MWSKSGSTAAKEPIFAVATNGPGKYPPNTPNSTRYFTVVNVDPLWRLNQDFEPVPLVDVEDFLRERFYINAEIKLFSDFYPVILRISPFCA